MDISKPLGLLGKHFFKNCTPIISDSTWRILPPQTMVVSLQYYLEYCTTLISPNCCPLEVSKGGLFLCMPYLCPHSICNGRGHGGVCLIGWLPYVRHL